MIIATEAISDIANILNDPEMSNETKLSRIGEIVEETF